MSTKEFDIVLVPGEDVGQLLAYLRQKFGVKAQVSPQQYNTALTVTVDGRGEQLEALTRWHSAKRLSK